MKLMRGLLQVLMRLSANVICKLACFKRPILSTVDGWHSSCQTKNLGDACRSSSIVSRPDLNTMLLLHPINVLS